MDIIIIDTSGRHALEEDLIQEIKDVADVAKPIRAHPGARRLGRPAGRSAGPGVPRRGRGHERHHHQDGRHGQGRRRPDRRRPDPRPPSSSSAWASTWRTWTRSYPTRFISRLLGMGDIADPAGDGQGEHQRGGGRRDHQEDHVRALHPEGDVRPDGDAHQHGSAEEADVHAARACRQRAGQDQRGGDRRSASTSTASSWTP